MLEPFSITNQQARIVIYIHSLLQYRNEVCQKDLEELMGLRGPSITSLLQGLEKRGYIVRKSGSTDGRTKLLSLTDKGLELQESFQVIFKQMEEKMLKGMTKKQKQTFLSLLEHAADNLED